MRGRGYIDRITIRPRNAPPQFTAVTAEPAVMLVWLGRRRIPGIEAGTELTFEGMVSRVDGLPTIYNPRYEIIGHPEDRA
jgi:hypothetical protein